MSDNSEHFFCAYSPSPSAEPAVYWLTGLSGAGKTTIGRELCARLRKRGVAAVLLDGDAMREVFGGVFGYSPEERRTCAGCYSRLCKLLADQGVTVVCCTVSMFDSVREWNRGNIRGYVEVYIRVPRRVLIERDQKGLYSGLRGGESSQVMGMDIEMEEPKSPDVVIDNDGSLSVAECVSKILVAHGRM